MSDTPSVVVRGRLWRWSWIGGEQDYVRADDYHALQRELAAAQAEHADLHAYKAATELALRQIYNMFDPPLIGTPGIALRIRNLRADLARGAYGAIADSVNEIADAAQEALRKAGIEPGEWDSDNIVQDVKRGIVAGIADLARANAGVPKALHIGYSCQQAERDCDRHIFDGSPRCPVGTCELIGTNLANHAADLTPGRGATPCVPTADELISALKDKP